MKSLYWVRNDLRFADNTALADFCANSEFGIFVVGQTVSQRRAASYRNQFYQESLFEFADNLLAKNQKILRTEMFFADFLESFLKSNHVDVLYFSAECAVEEVLEEQRVANICKANNVTVKSFSQATLIAEANLHLTFSQKLFVNPD